MPVSAKRIVSGWTHPIGDISEHITVSFQDESDTSNSRVKDRRRKKKKSQKKTREKVRYPLQAIQSVRMILCFVFSNTEKGEWLSI
jgi:hypothetical protein